MANPDLQSVTINDDDPQRIIAVFDIAVDVTDATGLTATVGGSGNTITAVAAVGATVYLTLTTMAAVGDAVLLSIVNSTTTIVEAGESDAALDETNFAGTNNRWNASVPFRYLAAENKARGIISRTARATKATCNAACDVVVDFG